MRHGLKSPARSPDERVQQRLANIENTASKWRGDTGWHSVGAAGEPAFQNAWTNGGGGFQTARFRRDQTGTVYIEGYVSGGVLTTAVFTLPVGYLPLSGLLFPGVGAGAFGYIQVSSGGIVSVNAVNNTGSTISCCFKASA